MKGYKIVIDTNVIFSGLYSKRGKSYKLLTLLDNPNIKVSVSVALILEYDDVLLRNLKEPGLHKSDVDDFLDYICKIANKRKIHYLWRPFLKDFKDDMVLEIAIESGSELIVTHNVKDFHGVENFGIKALTPKEFIKILEESE